MLQRSTLQYITVRDRSTVLCSMTLYTLSSTHNNTPSLRGSYNHNDSDIDIEKECRTILSLSHSHTLRPALA